MEPLQGSGLGSIPSGSTTECRKIWLIRLFRKQETVSSNLTTLTKNGAKVLLDGTRLLQSLRLSSTLNSSTTGYRKVWLIRLFWKQEIASSNLATLTSKERL